MQIYILTLTQVFCVFTIICGLTALGFWLHYRRQTEFEKAARNLNEYRYFIQPFCESETSVISYELVLKEFDPISQKWITPFNRKHFPLDRLIIAVKDLQGQIPDNVNSISINMTISQILDHQVPNFFNWLLGILSWQKLNIELEADEIMHLSDWQEIRLRMVLQKAYEKGILVTIKNIKSQEYYYEKLTQYDKYVDHYAISTHHFDLNKESLVKKWQDVSDFHYKKMILTGIENYRDNQYADKYQIMIRQGSYFSPPIPLKELIDRE